MLEQMLPFTWFHLTELWELWEWPTNGNMLMVLHIHKIFYWHRRPRQHFPLIIWSRQGVAFTIGTQANSGVCRVPCILTRNHASLACLYMNVTSTLFDRLNSATCQTWRRRVLFDHSQFCFTKTVAYHWCCYSVTHRFIDITAINSTNKEND